MKAGMLKVSILFVITVLMLPAQVWGHAYLEQSIPQTDSQLERSPVEIRAKFSEQIDTTASSLSLTDETGNAIEGVQTSEDGIWLILEHPPLDQGIYRVDWRILSMDSHVTTGQFEFEVLEPLLIDEPEIIELEELDEPELVEEDSPELELEREQPIIEDSESNQGEHDHHEHHEMEPDQGAVEVHKHGWMTFLRIVEVFAVVALGGIVFFRFIVLRDYQPTTHWLAKRQEVLLYFAGMIILLLTGIGHTLLTAQKLSGAEALFDPTTLDMAKVILSSTVVGLISWLRPVLLGLLAAMNLLNISRRFQAVMSTILVLLLALTFPITSHAYAEAGFWSLPVMAHALHLLFATVWFGGIVGLISLSFSPHISSTIDNLKQWISRFSTIALPSILIVTISGIALAYSNVGSWSRLFDSDYGQLIVWKAVLLLSVYIIAIIHRYVTIPRLQSKISSFIWAIRIEAIVALILILLAGFLSSTSP